VEEVSTPAEIAAFLKFVYKPAVQPGKRPVELFWVTTTLTDHPVDDNLPRYKTWETEASLYVSIDVLDHHTGIRYSALKGHTAVAARGLLVIVACALHHLAHTIDDEGSTLNPATLEDLVESFSFTETKKKSLAAKFCTVLCDTVNDKTTLLEISGFILPLDRHTIFVTFALWWTTRRERPSPWNSGSPSFATRNTSSREASPSRWCS
jgi:hypothetical protein